MRLPCMQLVLVVVEGTFALHTGGTTTRASLALLSMPSSTCPSPLHRGCYRRNTPRIGTTRELGLRRRLSISGERLAGSDEFVLFAKYRKHTPSPNPSDPYPDPDLGVKSNDSALFAKYRKPTPSPPPSPFPSPSDADADPDPDLDDATSQAERALEEAERVLAAVDGDRQQMRTPPGPGPLFGFPIPTSQPRMSAPPRQTRRKIERVTKDADASTARKKNRTTIRRDEAIASAVGGVSIGVAAGVALDVKLLDDLSLDFDLDDCLVPPAVLGASVGAAAFAAASSDGDEGGAVGVVGRIVRAAIVGPTGVVGKAVISRMERGVNETVENTRALPGRVVGAIENKVAETVDAVRRTPGRIGTAVADASARTVERIVSAPGVVAEGTRGAVRSAVERGVNRAREIQGEVGRAIETRAEETIEVVKGSSAEAVERLKDTLWEQGEEVKDGSVDALERIKDTLRKQAAERRQHRQARALLEEMEEETAYEYDAAPWPERNISDESESVVTGDSEGKGWEVLPAKDRVRPTPTLEEQWAAARERDARERAKRIDEQRRRFERAFARESEGPSERGVEEEARLPTAREHEKNEAGERKGGSAERRQPNVGRADDPKHTLAGEESTERRRRSETDGGTASAGRGDVERYSAIADVAARQRADAGRALTAREERSAERKRSLAERATSERSLARRRAEETRRARRAEREAADLKRKEADAAEAQAAARKRRRAEERKRILAKEKEQAKRRRLADAAAAKARAAKLLARKEADRRASAAAAREAADRKRRINVAKVAARKQSAEREKRTSGQCSRKQVARKKDEAVFNSSAQSSVTVSLFTLFQGSGDGGRTSSPAAPKLTSKQRLTKAASWGVPIISNWRKNRDGSIAGYISGSPKYSDGQTITTSRIKGSIVGGTVVTTFSGSRYYLLEPSKTTSVDRAAKPGATLSLSGLFRLSGDDATAADVLKQPLKRRGKNIAPRGVPIISRWRKSDDGCIAGFISGSPSYKDGETIATSRIKGTPVGGTVIETVSGSRYFLEPNRAERGFPWQRNGQQML